ncbi:MULTISPECIES: nucleotidyltransferase domain-containing protein [Nonomuraea]|uniref:Nucleotidyltransferase domain-containing protein n=2 Tax=Nonomuraea TaxID=83681 RepID=A0ABW1C4M3_9ACTN|nr:MULTISPECIES: nucleotidyltransferase domain-containing protein [Nonomuraea]MDA0639702.1 nucleotidyltransferase domain-containing protein [Nonomuraea ferruginea]
MHTSTEILLTRFLSEAGAAVPLMAVWAHGSLAKGDYQPGRSDLDLIAVVREPLDERRRDAVERLHRGLDGALAERLHCSYMTDGQLAEHGREHVTWAMGELFERPVTAVTRRELLTGALELYGPGPDALIPPVSDAELAAFVQADLRDFWLVKTRGRRRWLLDEWVDLGMVTVARAAVTLRDGRLISKREALDVLGEMGAPPVVVDGIRARRYGTDGPVLSRFRRAKLARRFIRQAIVRVLG